MGEITTYDVESFTLGVKDATNKIVFKTIDDMNCAYKDLDNGNDLQIKKDGVVTKLLHQMIASKVYDGTILFCALVGGN